MNMKEQLQSALRDAMRAGDELRKRTLRLVLAAVQLAEVDQRRELADPDILAIIQKEVKARREAIEDAHRAGRDELVVQAEREIAVLQEFLPSRLGEAELRQLAEEAIEQLGATGLGDMGKVMARLMPLVRDRADGGEVSQLVRQLLGEGQG